MVNFLSPLTKTGKVSLVKNINKKEIIKSYHFLNIDVSKYFKNRDIVSIYKCEDTGYKFYFPATCNEIIVAYSVHFCDNRH